MNATTYQVTINGETKSISASCSLASMLVQLELSNRGIAVEVDGELIPHDQFDSFLVSEGSNIEIVSFVGGG